MGGADMASKSRDIPAATNLQDFVRRAIELGAKEAKIISARSIVTAPWVRVKCQYGCPMYGARLTCPPHSPSPDETREIIAGFKKCILVEGEMLKVTPLVAALEREVFLAGYYKALALGDGPCVKCAECSLDKGCQFPFEARPSMEAAGIDVYQTLKNNGITIEVAQTPDSRHRHHGIVLVE
jgi:predicted metal-binding protein